jgi:hypothetical protein
MVDYFRKALIGERSAGPGTPRPSIQPVALNDREPQRAPSERHEKARDQRATSERPMGLTDEVEMVGARGFEPPTSSSRTMRATKLRHAPTEGARCHGACG